MIRSLLTGLAFALLVSILLTGCPQHRSTAADRAEAAETGLPIRGSEQAMLLNITLNQGQPIFYTLVIVAVGASNQTSSVPGYTSQTTCWNVATAVDHQRDIAGAFCVPVQ